MSRAVKKERFQNLRREAKRTDTEHGKRTTAKGVCGTRGEETLEERDAVTALDPELRDKPSVKQAREKVRELGGKGRRPVSILGQIHGLGPRPTGLWR